MAQEIEIEFKNLLTKKEYEFLLTKLPFPNGQEQINYYFETPDLRLRTLGSALRIRKKKDMYQLTLKQPYQDGLLETHDELTDEEAREWMNGNPIPKEYTTKQLNNMGIEVSDLQYYGSLQTTRREYKEKGIIYVLDHSKYHDQEDYELEIEATDKESGLKAMDTILHTFGIDKKDTPNKIARFFQSLEN
ncbi:CYTH domain-containing protein [Ornithinibacillus californiensis]|uniref:CYTH domain-containing protein n=1 Tax=Ornithinibacillus californiensis TaxID=161536 RepID=UPI00064E0271|nr:CYTH domain-containing protein [Ornithinibacillus californiensis]